MAVEHTSQDHTHVRFSFLRIMGLLLFALVIVVLSSVGTYFFVLNELNQQIEARPSVNKDRSKPTPSIDVSPSPATDSATTTPTKTPTPEVSVTTTPTQTPTPTP